MSIESLALAWFAVLALALFIVGMRSYLRSCSPKLAMVAIGFLIFFVQAVVLSYSLFTDTLKDETLWLLVVVLDSVALVFIFAGIYKR